MKILIITPIIGINASGDVFGRLIEGLSKSHEVDVLTYDNTLSCNTDFFYELMKCKKAYIHPRISKLLIALFGVDFYDCLWARNAERLLISKKKKGYDMVLSFIHSNEYAPLIAAKKISLHYKCKVAVYAIDAIPAPGWPENKFYFNGVKRLIKRYMYGIDALYSSN